MLTGISMLPVAEQADDDEQSENSSDGQGSEVGKCSVSLQVPNKIAVAEMYF